MTGVAQRGGDWAGKSVFGGWRGRGRQECYVGFSRWQLRSYRKTKVRFDVSENSSSMFYEILLSHCGM